VPSPLHDAYVTFFRTHIDCAIRLAIEAGLDLPNPCPPWQVIPGDFGDPGRCGKEFHADLVLAAFPPGTSEPAPAGTRALATLVIEPQLGFDEGKGVSWLVYRAGVASATTASSTGAMSPGPIRIGRSPGLKGKTSRNWTSTFGLGTRASTHCAPSPCLLANPPWAALSASFHTRGPFARSAAVVALQTCTRLPADERRCTFDLVCAGLPRNIMQQVRQDVPEATKSRLTEYEREGAWYLDGRDEGLAEGREEGREEGRAEGLAEGLLLLLASRGIAVEPEQRSQIETCTDPEQLRRWFDRALRASNVAEILNSDD
jgi:hypothetical protein